MTSCVRYCFCTALGRQINKHEFSLMTKYVSHCFVICDGKNKAMQTQAAAAFHLNEQQPAVSSLLNPVKCNGQSLAPGLDLYWMHTLFFFFLILPCWQHLHFRIMIWTHCCGKHISSTFCFSKMNFINSLQAPLVHVFLFPVYLLISMCGMTVTMLTGRERKGK